MTVPGLLPNTGTEHIDGRRPKRRTACHKLLLNFAGVRHVRKLAAATAAGAAGAHLATRARTRVA